MHGSLNFSNPASSPSKNSIFWGCDIFYVIYSIVLSPPAMAAPPPRPLAIGFDNPSLCFCNEKQHSSRGMTSSVSTGAGTEDATLPADWIAPTGCCERKSASCHPRTLAVLMCVCVCVRAPENALIHQYRELDGSLCSSELTHQGPRTII